jgi:hypothetical protein
VLPNGAVGEKFVAFKDNFAEGRKIEGIENFEAGRHLPTKKKRNDTDNAEPVGNQFARSLPQPVRRQRIRLVDRNEIDSILLLLRRSGASGLTAKNSIRRWVRLSRCLALRVMYESVCKLVGREGEGKKWLSDLAEERRYRGG